MGHTLSEKGVTVDDEKVRAINEAARPTTVQEVRSWLGLVNFCGRYICNLATIEEPLRRLTRKNTQWNWGSEQEKAFNDLKRNLTNSPTMAYFDHMRHTELIVDASPVGLGAVLVQTQEDGYVKPVMFASRFNRCWKEVLSNRERRSRSSVGLWKV